MKFTVSLIAMMAVVSRPELCAADGMLRSPSMPAYMEEEEKHSPSLIRHRSLEEEVTKACTKLDEAIGKINNKQGDEDGNEGGEEDGDDNNDDQVQQHVQDTLSAAQTTVKTISSCSSSDGDSPGCRPDDVAKDAFNVIMDVGLAVGTALEPLGGALVAIGALGDFIATLIGDGNKDAVKGLTIEKIEEACKYALGDYDVFKADSEISQLSRHLKNQIMENRGTINTIKAVTTQAEVDEEVDDWFGYFKDEWDNIQKSLGKIDDKYQRAFGPSTQSPGRGSILNWMKTCHQCELYYWNGQDNFNKKYLGKGIQNHLKQCKASASSIKGDLLHMQSFYAHMKLLSVHFVMWYSSALHIFGQRENCNLSKFGNADYKVKCKQHTTMNHVVQSIKNDVLKYVKALDKTVVEDIPKYCTDDYRWPLNQINYLDNGNECTGYSSPPFTGRDVSITKECPLKYLVFMPYQQTPNCGNNGGVCSFFGHRWAQSTMFDICREQLGKFDAIATIGTPFYGGVWGFRHFGQEVHNHLYCPGLGGAVHKYEDDDWNDDSYVENNVNANSEFGYPRDDMWTNKNHKVPTVAGDNGWWTNGAEALFSIDGYSNTGNWCEFSLSIANEGGRAIGSLAIPSYCPTHDLPKCYGLFKHSENFGL